MDVDAQKTNGLIAKAKITQFEVEFSFYFTFFSWLICMQL